MAMATFSVVYCQNTFKATILDADSNEPLIGVNVLFEEPNKGGVTDLDGTVAIENLPNGNYEVRVSYVSYETIELEVSLPQQEPLTILLESGSEELETVTVTTTRSSRLIQDLPTRLEAITAEELGEKAAMNVPNTNGNQTTVDVRTCRMAWIRIPVFWFECIDSLPLLAVLVWIRGFVFARSQLRKIFVRTQNQTHSSSKQRHH